MTYQGPVRRLTCATPVTVTVVALWHTTPQCSSGGLQTTHERPLDRCLVRFRPSHAVDTTLRPPRATPITSDTNVGLDAACGANVTATQLACPTPPPIERAHITQPRTSALDRVHALEPRAACRTIRVAAITNSRRSLRLKDTTMHTTNTSSKRKTEGISSRSSNNNSNAFSTPASPCTISTKEGDQCSNRRAAMAFRTNSSRRGARALEEHMAHHRSSSNSTTRRPTPSPRSSLRRFRRPTTPRRMPLSTKARTRSSTLHLLTQTPNSTVLAADL